MFGSRIGGPLSGPGGCDCVHLEDQVVVHTREGDAVCTTCARVIEACAMDQGPEWWGAEAARGVVPGRDDVLGLESSNGAVFSSKKRYAAPDPHRATRAGLREVERCAGCMGIGSDHVVCVTAKTVYTDYAETRRAAGRTVRETERLAVAACSLYFGCKHERVSRSIKEISGLCQVALQECTDLLKSFKTMLGEKPYARMLFATVDAGDLLVRAVSGIAFDSEAEKRKILKKAREVFDTVVRGDLLEGRAPETVCSAVLYRAFELEGIKTTKKIVYSACAVSNVTLNKALKDLKVHV